MKLGSLLMVLFAAHILLGERSHAANGNPGRAAYLRYCGSCHGMDAAGAGVVAGSMRTKPTDLRNLAKENGGTFPYAGVHESIDGRKRIAAHGTSEMPVWGEVFAEEKTHEPPEVHARSQVAIITQYLASIQMK